MCGGRIKEGSQEEIIMTPRNHDAEIEDSGFCMTTLPPIYRHIIITKVFAMQ